MEELLRDDRRPQSRTFERDSFTGLVGAAGGLGGFLLPTILGSLRDMAGSYGAGLAVIALAAGAALVGTLVTRGTWRASPAMAGAPV